MNINSLIGLLRHLLVVMNGNKIINSTSKITNTNATKKKWTLKDKRNSENVLKPHSKGLWSSRSANIFFITRLPSPNKTLDNTQDVISNTKATNMKRKI